MLLFPVWVPMAAEGSVWLPRESRCCGLPLVASLASGVGSSLPPVRVRVLVCAARVRASAGVWGGWQSTSATRTCRFCCVRRCGSLGPCPPSLAHGVGSKEQPLAAVAGADVGGAYAAPSRVIPRAGQVCEYAVESASLPAQGGHVLHDEQVWS
jgi:hypothetical protein